jgi:hypothetical protein
VRYDGRGAAMVRPDPGGIPTVVTAAGTAAVGVSGVSFGSLLAAAELAAKAVTPVENLVVKRHHEHRIAGIWRAVLAESDVPVGGRVGRRRDARTRVAKDIVAMLDDPHQLLASDAVRGLQVQDAREVLDSPNLPESPDSVRDILSDLAGSGAGWEDLGARLLGALKSGDAEEAGVEDRFRQALERLGIGRSELELMQMRPPPDPQQRLGDLLALLAYAQVRGEKQPDWRELFRSWQRRDWLWRSSTHFRSRIKPQKGDSSANGQAADLLPAEVRIWGHHTALKFLQAADGRRELGEFRAALEDDTAGWLTRELELRRQATLADMAGSARQFVRLVAFGIAVVVVAAGLDAADLVDVTRTVDQVWASITD